MADKKPEDQPVQDNTKSKPDKDKKMDKTPSTTVQVDVPPVTHVTSVPIFTKASPNDLYRRLLPAILFVLTFVTVMTMLLVYMDTVALNAAQFRANMSREYSLARIPADSAALVAYVRQLQLAPRQAAPLQPVPTRDARALDRAIGVVYNGTFVEMVPSGPRDQTTQFLESMRGWRGLVARAAPRDYLALRGPTALHACLSTEDHPAEISYHGPDEPSGNAFSSRVLCLPLLSALLAAKAPSADFVLLGGDRAPKALAHMKWDMVELKVIEYRSTDPIARNETTEILLKNNYQVLEEFDDAIMYNLVKQ